MNFVDVVIICLMVAAGIRGHEIGFVRQFCSLVGMWIGLMIGGQIVSLFSLKNTLAISIIIGFVVVGVILGEFGGVKLKQVLHETKINIVDRAFGSLMGVLMCLIAVWLGSALISIINYQTLQQGIRDSAIIRYLDRSLPPATDAIANLEAYLSKTGVPDVVQTTEPTLSGDTPPLPDIQNLATAISSTKPSVVEIEGRACSGIEAGSGFVAATGLVVTNAHVVAGMRVPFIRDEHGRHSARVVAFDPDLDLAVLAADNLAGEPLPVLASKAAKGTPIAVLGYPGGGDLVTKPGVISDTITAVGKDIYDSGNTRREVYAIRADVEKGNSGGPIVDTKGTVIGVIFARSTSYYRVGYALTGEEVNSVVSTAKTNPSTDQNLRCIQ